MTMAYNIFCLNAANTSCFFLSLGQLASKSIYGKSLNSGDITAGYIVTDIERLRKPMQQITDYFLKCMGVQPSAAVLAIQPQGVVHE